MTSETKVKHTEESLRQEWREYRKEARQLDLEPEEFLEYLIRRLNIAEESDWMQGYNDGLTSAKLDWTFGGTL